MNEIVFGTHAEDGIFRQLLFTADTVRGIVARQKRNTADTNVVSFFLGP